MGPLSGALLLSLVTTTLAPLAERLGLDAGRAQLEDVSFRVFDPLEADALQVRLPHPDQDDEVLGVVVDATSDALANLGLDGVVTHRVKSLYSTHRKMLRKGVDLDGIHDRLAVRVRVDTVQDCYRLRDALLTSLAVVAGEDDDYIAFPKASGYRSLHTAVRVPTPTGDGIAEIQIRTHTMHADAESGAQAHWRYKLVA